MASSNGEGMAFRLGRRNDGDRDARRLYRGVFVSESPSSVLVVASYACRRLAIHFCRRGATAELN